jgi:hypothetical protein
MKGQLRREIGMYARQSIWLETSASDIGLVCNDDEQEAQSDKLSAALWDANRYTYLGDRSR